MDFVFASLPISAIKCLFLYINSISFPFWRLGKLDAVILPVILWRERVYLLSGRGRLGSVACHAAVSIN